MPGRRSPLPERNATASAAITLSDSRLTAAHSEPPPPRSWNEVLPCFANADRGRSIFAFTVRSCARSSLGADLSRGCHRIARLHLLSYWTRPLCHEFVARFPLRLVLNLARRTLNVAVSPLPDPGQPDPVAVHAA